MRTLAIALALAAPALASLQQSAPDAQADTAPAAPDPATTTPLAQLTEQEARALIETLDDGQTAIVEAGDEPRRALRFTPLAGYGVTYDATQYLAVERTYQGAPVRTSALPTHTARITTRVSDIDPARALTVTSTLADPGVDPDSDTNEAAKASIAALLEPLDGVASVRRLDFRGLPVAPDDVRTDPTDDRELALRLTQTALLPVLILPEEPVGAGAVWHARRDVVEDTAEQTLVYSYTLTHADDDTISVRVHARYLLDAQTLPPNPRMPELVTTILQGAGTLIGEMTFDRRAAAPTDAFLRTDASLQVEGKSPRAPAAIIEQRLFSEITIAPPAEHADEK